LKQYQQAKGIAVVGGLDVGEKLQKGVEKLRVPVLLLGEGL
jgi:hypothetical protein